jgi:hypothetical protein
MLIWIIGNPNPQALRDQMAVDINFKTEVFRWIESIISCELPGMSYIRVEKCEAGKHPPKPPPNYTDPRLVHGPFAPTSVEGPESEEFQKAFRETVHALAV